MMKKLCLSIVMTTYLLLSGCATVLTERSDFSKSPEGIRIYPPKTYFFVDNQKYKTKIILLPDYANAYDIKPFTFIAKQDFNLEINEIGMLNKITANQDSTAFVELIKAIGDIAKSAEGIPPGNLSVQDIDGCFGLSNGMYTLTLEGKLIQVAPPKRD